MKIAQIVSVTYGIIFSNDILTQLALLSPLIIVDCLGLIFGARLLIRKKGKRLAGTLFLITLASFALSAAMLFALPLTSSSYGQVQPVAIVFSALYIFLLDGTCFCVIWVFPRLHARLVPVIYSVVHVVVLGVLFYAFYIEPFWVDVTHTQVALRQLPAGTPPITVVLLSDIHIERWTRREDTVIEDLSALHPDMIVLAGDYLNIDHVEPQAFADLHRFFAALHAPYGVYAVAGVTDFVDYTQTLAGTDVQLLKDTFTTVTIKGAVINLVGLSNSHLSDDAAMLAQVSRNVPKGTPKFLIYHAPDLIHESAAAGYDFYFAGHTHGGQIALPFFGAIYTSSRYGLAYKAGLYDLGGPADTRLYITRGIGMEGMNAPRARLFARPEISVITFVPNPM